jgi:hypothetical protein
MRADPDPQETVGHVHGDRAITSDSYSDRINVPHFFKAQPRSARILAPEAICAAGCLFDWFRQLAIELPELTRRRRFHPSAAFFR